MSGYVSKVVGRFAVRGRTARRLGVERPSARDEGATRRAEGSPSRAIGRRRALGRENGGAALTEFAVLALVMVPLLLAVPMLGNLVDLRQTAVQAARYVAWEATVDASGRAPTDVRARFFGEADAPLSSRPSDPGSNALWGERGAAPARAATESADGAGHEAVATRAPRSLALRIDEGGVGAFLTDDAFAGGDVGPGGAGVARRTGETVRDVGGLIAKATGGEWDLTAHGLVRGGVRVDVDANAWLDAGTLTESAVAVVDGWSVGDDGEAKRRVRSFVPAAVLRPVGDAIATVGYLPVFAELRRLDGAFGHIDLSRLPESERGERPLRPYEESRP